MTTNKNIRIRVNGFDIYLGISKNDKRKREQLEKAYKNQIHRAEDQQVRFKQEHSLAKLY